METSDIRLWGRLLAILRDKKGWFAFALVLMLLAKVIEVLIPPFLGELMHMVLGGNETMEAILWAGVEITVLVGIAYVLESVNSLIMVFLGQRAIYRLRTRLFEHIQSLHVGFFARQRVGQLMSRTVSDVDRIQQGVSEALIGLIGNALLLVGIVIGMLVVDWRIGLVLLVTLPFLFVLTESFRRGQRRGFARVREALGQLNTFIQEHLIGLRIIRNFGLEARERSHFDRLNRAFRDRNVETVYTYALFFAGLEWFRSAFLIAVFVGLVEFAFSGTEFRAGIFFTYNLYTLAFFRPIYELTDRYNTLQEAVSSAERVFELLDVKPAVHKGNGQRLEGVESLHFDRVWFAYEESEWVLRDVQLEIAKGETVALVGETGAGKSTLASLLLRFYDVQRGSIRVNGRLVTDYSLKSLRRQFSICLQDPVLFSGTMRDNITLFDEKITDEVALAALDYVGAMPLIERMALGLDSRLQERGKNLSAGERQLVSLARAIAHPSSVIILDEATANIDAVTERAIQQALARILSERTSLVIAHRLSTIRRADKIAVIHKGAVKEIGTHDQLMARRGFYEKLVRAQYSI